MIAYKSIVKGDRPTMVIVKKHEMEEKVFENDLFNRLENDAASPYKFAGDVYYGLTGDRLDKDAFETMDALAAYTGTAAPEALTNLKNLDEIHTGVCDPGEMEQRLRERFVNA